MCAVFEGARRDGDVHVAAAVDANPDVRIGNTSSATFDPIAGRIATRTDENGNIASLSLTTDP